MTAHLDHWTELLQAGRLLDRGALESLAEPGPLSVSLVDRLRDAITALPADRAARGEALGQLLDLVLVDLCKIATGWAKGPGVAATHAERLIDGTELKPRRLLTRDGQEVLAVFTTPAERVGIHQGRRPVAHAVEYLRRRRIPLGLVTNGHDWRLLFADADNYAWVQWSADRWLDGDLPHASLALLRRVLSPATLSPRGDGATFPLLEAIRATRRGQAKLSKELGERVRAAVELLLRSRRPVLEPVWSAQDPKTVYVAACHFVMRLVVVLFAEGRELLPVDSPVYHQAYGIRGLIEAMERAGVDRRRGRCSAWPRLLALFRLIHGGSPHPQLLVTAYGGDLFRAGDPAGDPIQRALAVLEATAEPPDDDIIYRVLTLLTRTTERVRDGAGWRTVAAPVDFTELTSEYIGILYEGLLDYELHRAGSQPIVFLGLGEQPALPLDRLEQMDDRQLAALVEKAKVKRKAQGEEEAEEDAEEDEEAEGDEEEAEEEADAAPTAGGAPSIEELQRPDDERAKALARALKWAERAAVAGKLIKAPRGRSGRDDPAWKAQLDAAAKQLVVDLKLPGEFYLVRWGGTRKGAGTFYTRPQLTLPTVRRTLEPLLTEPNGTVRKPEELLALKVCDPAMGSGSFLVAAIRILTEKVVESLHVHGRIRRDGDHVRLDCEPLPDADRDQPEERVEAIVRRAVVEHCIYGVDVDPLAVELARVALWVETLDRRLPFTFLDHKLRCGDALVGTWLDRFRDYPLLAWWRKSPDEKWKGVHFKADVWDKALKEKRKSVVAEQVEVLTGQRSLLVAGVSDDDLKASIERVRELYRRLRKVPASQPDKRAEIWRKQVAPDPALAHVREAFDAWCALWFWPLDRLDDAPTPKSLASPSGTARAVVRELREAKRFFHWELEFPDVFTQMGAGFDAVVGNPPWEIQKPSSKEFFSDRDPLYRSYGKQEALGRQQQLFDTDPGLEGRWLDYVGQLKAAGNFVAFAGEPFGDVEDGNGKPEVTLVARQAEESRRLHKKWAAERARRSGLSDPKHSFRHQGSADLNTYKLFVEQALAILKDGGQVGLLTPSGLYTDKGSVALRRVLLDRCEWRWLYGFENRNGIFDIHRSFKFAVTIARKGSKTEALQAAFMHHDLEDWASATGALAYPAERVRAFSPKSLSILEIRSGRDLEVLTKMYANSVLLGDEGPDGWGVKYATEFHMTNDSGLFVPREKAEEKGYRPDEHGRWMGPGNEEVLLPLYEGRMIGQFDFSKKGWVRGKGRGAEWRDIPWDKKVMEPQFLMSQADYLSAADREGKPKAVRGVKLGFMDVGSATNTRTMIAGLTFDCPHGNKVPVLAVERDVDSASPQRLCGILNSYSFDFAMRARLGGLTLNYFIVEETPIPSPQRSAGGGMAAAVCALAAPHPRFAPVWLSIQRQSPVGGAWRARWAITQHERLRTRCIVDAVAGALYGVNLSDLRWVLRDCDRPRAVLADKALRRTLDPKGFWRVDKDQDPELRHTVLTLVAFGELEKSIAEHAGDRDKGIAAFMALNGGQGWMLPETLRLADYGLGHDERAKEQQPVASRLGPRFLDWQVAQSPEESWAECERHARAILGDDEFERRFGSGQQGAPQPSALPSANPGGSPKRRKGSRPSKQRKLFE